jgi:predicted negative regulator of RcsB-dependent stress response
VDQYHSEEEQLEALRRWWDENGRSTIISIVIALAAVFGWQSWRNYDQGQQELASDIYQSMLQVANSTDLTAEQRITANSYANRLKEDYPGTTYAQFAGLHLARQAVDAGELDDAEAQLRWVLGKADKGGDVATVAELRLARVLAAKGDPEQALAILKQADDGTYGAAYAVARGDILLALGRDDEAGQAYGVAQAMAAGAGAQLSGGTLDQKLQSIAPVPVSASARATPTDDDGAADNSDQGQE